MNNRREFITLLGGAPPTGAVTCNRTKVLTRWFLLRVSLLRVSSLGPIALSRRVSRKALCGTDGTPQCRTRKSPKTRNSCGSARGGLTKAR
jgi:hypothetical protein